MGCWLEVPFLLVSNPDLKIKMEQLDFLMFGTVIHDE